MMENTFENYKQHQEERYENMEAFVNNDVVAATEERRRQLAVEYVNYLKSIWGNPTKIAQSLEALAICINVAVKDHNPNVDILLLWCTTVARGLRIHAKTKNPSSFYVGVFNQTTNSSAQTLDEQRRWKEKSVTLKHPLDRNIVALLSKDCYANGYTKEEIMAELTACEPDVTDSLMRLLESDWIETRCVKVVRYYMRADARKYWDMMK